MRALIILRPVSLWLILSLLELCSSWALDPGRLLSQYAHTGWKTSDGAFVGSPTTITQTADGYLWIGTNLGLVRFDGVRFVQWSPPPGQHLLDSRIFSLVGSRDGSLWIGTGYSLSRWKDGELTNYSKLSGRIEALLENNGSVWAARTQMSDELGPLCRVGSAPLHCYGTSDQVPFPNVLQLATSDDGEIWLAGYSELCRWKPGEAGIYFPNRTGRPEGYALFKGIASSSDGSSAWAVIDAPGPALRLEHFVDHHWTIQLIPQIPASNSEVTTLFVDRENELWIGTANHGLFRVRGDQVEQFDTSDGLSSNSVRKFFQDQEGSLWVVTSSGVDNFRDLKVATYTIREGLSADGAVSVLGSHDGGVWVINNYETLQKLKDGKFSTFLPRPDVPGNHISTIFEDHAGTLWVGIENDLYVYDNGTFRVIRHSDGTALGIIFSITEDVNQNIWVRAGPNLDEIEDFQVRKEETSPLISTAYILAATSDGGLVLGLVDGALVRYKNGNIQVIRPNETRNTRQIRDLLVDPDGTIWGTTLDELFCLRGSRRQNLTVRNGLPCDGIFALVKDDANAIWLDSRCGLIQIPRSELDRWWQQPDSVVHTQVIDGGDGVQPGLTSLKPQATRTPDGRLWFVNGSELQMIDVNHLRKNPIPPPVHIEGVVADRVRYDPRDGLRLPALTSDLEIGYTALSFVAPQKVRFRYMLEGRDVRWQEPGTRRQAFYTDLKPGSYRFHVISSNNDGVWNETGAALRFSIAPAWFQTTWFRVLCCLLALFIAWTIYRLRVRQIAATLNARFDERMNERTRLARELHDTLLQTIQGSKMVADNALDQPNDPVRMHQALQRLSAWMGQATQEGRAALNSLRASTTQRNNLAEALRRATESDLIPQSVSVTFSVVGTASEMHPIARDEIYRIGYEAIHNAGAHSRASRLEVELKYAQNLTLRIRDNGIGIDPAIIDAGKEDHYGLAGMRERSERIGSKLTVVSSASSGTEIQLIVPGSVIFQTTPGQKSLFAKLRTFLARNGSRPSAHH
jgi:signal transduction histidine kinase/ligand-binding sensor domain-containing protein